MEAIKTFSKRCLIIKPDQSINSIVLSFDTDIEQPLINIDNKSLKFIMDNFKIKYNCSHHTNNVACALYPDHTYYSIFFESNNSNSIKPFNQIATQLVGNNIKCYGNCFVVHFDQFFDMYDIDKETFVTVCNKRKLTSIGIVERKDKIEPKMNKVIQIQKQQSCTIC